MTNRSTIHTSGADFYVCIGAITLPVEVARLDIENRPIRTVPTAATGFVQFAHGTQKIRLNEIWLPEDSMVEYCVHYATRSYVIHLPDARDGWAAMCELLPSAIVAAIREDTQRHAAPSTTAKEPPRIRLSTLPLIAATTFSVQMMRQEGESAYRMDRIYTRPISVAANEHGRQTVLIRFGFVDLGRGSVYLHPTAGGRAIRYIRAFKEICGHVGSTFGYEIKAGEAAAILQEQHAIGVG